MAKRKLIDKLIHKDNIKEELRYIEISKNAYAATNGDIYVYYGDDMFLKLKQQPVQGYMYVSILLKSTNKRVSKRVHRLIAQTFIDNPHNYNVVGHLDNNKSNNNIDNLYWTTVKENTQKAYDDGLARNDKSWDDSQSIPVCQFDLKGNFIKSFGSVSEASRNTGMTKTGILQQCRHKSGKSKPRKGYYYRFKNEFDDKGFVL